MVENGEQKKNSKCVQPQGYQKISVIPFKETVPEGARRYARNGSNGNVARHV